MPEVALKLCIALGEGLDHLIWKGDADEVEWGGSGCAKVVLIAGAYENQVAELDGLFGSVDPVDAFAGIYPEEFGEVVRVRVVGCAVDDGSGGVAALVCVEVVLEMELSH